MAKGGELQRYVLTVTKNYSTTDARQITAAVTVYPFFQGATVSGQSTTTISVYDINDIKVGDTLEKFTEDGIVPTPDTDQQMTVSSITDQQTFDVAWVGADVTVTDGDRLIIVNRAANQDRYPRVYGSDTLDDLLNSEPSGFTTDQGTTPITSSSASGEASFYVQPRYFDIVLDDGGVGITTRLLADQVAGQGRTMVNAVELGVHADADQARSALNRVVLTDAFARIARPGHPVSKLWLPRGPRSSTRTLIWWRVVLPRTLRSRVTSGRS